MPRRTRPSQEWQPLVKGEYGYAERQRIIHDFGIDAASEVLSFEIWLNNKYTVAMRRQKNQNPNVDLPDLIHLSIKRNDKNPIRDWRDFQLIKNQLVGPECEGVELFPAESRLIDTGNQYHVWVWDDPAFRFPIGFQEGRIVSNNEDSGNKQRRDDTFPDALPNHFKEG